MAKVHIFWDNSNIFIGAQTAFQAVRGRSSNIRVDFSNLAKLAIAGRQLSKGYCVGSIPPEVREVWRQLRVRTGIQPELYERGAETGREQALDQALQVWMLRAALDEPVPQVAVLLTGDGKGFEDGVGFHADLKRLHDRGWGIEVLSWNRSCASALKNWAEGAGKYIALDDYLDSLVFEQGLTSARHLNLTRRPKALPAGAPRTDDSQPGPE